MLYTQGMSSSYMESDVIAAAYIVRRQFENQTYDWKRLNELYVAYAGVSLNRAKTEASKPKLNCELATVALRDFLGEGMIVPSGTGRYGQEDHAFLMVHTRDAGQVIADITADQFPDGPAVYVGKLETPWHVEQPAVIGLPSWAVLHNVV